MGWTVPSGKDFRASARVPETKILLHIPNGEANLLGRRFVSV